MNTLKAQTKDYEYRENNTTKIKVTTDTDGNKIINKDNRDGSSSTYSIEKQSYDKESTVYEYDKSNNKKKIGEIENKEINKIENTEYINNSYSSSMKTGLDKTKEGNYWRYIYKDGKKVYITFYKKKSYGSGYEVYECHPNGNRTLRGEIKEVN